MDSRYSFASHTESWVEVSSRPSSSSLSSAATDDVVALESRGLRDDGQRRRRRLFRPTITQVEGRIPSRTLDRNGSSTEEYGESEGDSDRIMTSSTEDLEPRFRVENLHNGTSSTKSRRLDCDRDSLPDSEDDIATALGRVDGSNFTPQPNIFSHPPSARLTHQEEDLYFPPLPSSHTSSSRPTIPASAASSSSGRPTQRARSHTPYNMLAPNASVDHDAALRASLSTLLSCAAAARGLHKGETQTAGPSRSTLPPRSRGSNRVEPVALRIIPESALTQIEEQPMISQLSPPVSNTPSSPSSLPSKRKSKSPMRDRRKKNRSIYGNNNEDVMSVSPTLTTWVVSAGVLVLFSAISFTAGYVSARLDLLV